ncbi:MAG TPA: galactosyldiacylglycerol synthase [bacterium]|nr:galactosyldiacylglycerol synthase [bacterium]
MITLREKASNRLIGQVTEEQFQFLNDHLEEESENDDDYFLTPDTIDMLADDGADEALVELLRNALGEKDDLEIRWEKK